MINDYNRPETASQCNRHIRCARAGNRTRALALNLAVTYLRTDVNDISL